MRSFEKPREKISDEKTLKALKYYEEFSDFLAIYNKLTGKTGIDFKQSINPIIYLKKQLKKDCNNGKQYEEKFQRYQDFSSLMKKAERLYAQVDLTDITSARSRNVIGGIISESNAKNDNEFVRADLDSVAVIKGYGLYKAVEEIQENKDENNKAEVLKRYDITEAMYQKACDRIETYESQGKREDYDRKRRGDKSQNIVHITAAVLEISPAEAERNLEEIDQIHGKENEFDKRYKVDLESGTYKFTIDEMNRYKEQLKKIIARINLEGETRENMLLFDEVKHKYDGAMKRLEKQKDSRVAGAPSNQKNSSKKQTTLDDVRDVG